MRSSPQKRLQHIKDIYSNSSEQGRWSFFETDAYVVKLEQKIASLAENPNRFSRDEHTRRPLEYRSFQHGAHKVFYTVDNDTMTVYVAAILGSTTNYGKNLTLIFDDSRVILVW